MSQKLENLKVNFSKESLGNMMEECQLPKEWKWVRLGEVIQEALPGFACGKRAGSEGFIQLRMNNISGNGQLNLSSVLRVPATKEQIERYRLIPRDVIFNNTNSAELVGKTTLFDEINGIFLYSNHLTRLRPVFKVLESSYLALWLQLQWYLRIFERICNRWIGQAAVQREKLLNLEIPLPCFSEQKRIAVKVKELMQEVERARTACEKQLDTVKALLSAYLREVFESEEAKKWERKKLGELCVFSSGKFLQKEEVKNKGLYPVYGANGVIGFTGEKIFDKEVIIIGRVGSCGTVNKTLGPAWITDNTIILQMHYKIDFDYLYWLLRSLKLEDFRAASVQPLITQKDLKPLLVPIPSLSEQKHIATKLKEKMEQIEKLRKTIEEQLDSINTLPQAILKKAFMGEL